MKPILLFDGICNLCNHAVDFVIRHDPGSKLRLGSLQSDAAQQLLLQNGIESERELSTLLLVTNEGVFSKSTAVLKAGQELKGFRWWSRLGWLVPRFLRDWTYDQIARSRYRVFGRREICRIPTPEELARFIQ